MAVIYELRTRVHLQGHVFITFKIIIIIIFSVQYTKILFSFVICKIAQILLKLVTVLVK